MSIQTFLKGIQRSPVVTGTIPLEAQMGLPVLSMVGPTLCVQCFFATTQLTEQTLLLHTPQYVLLVSYPHGRLLSFSNLAFDPRFADTDFAAPVGQIILSQEAGEAHGRRMDTVFRQCGALLARYEEEGTLDAAALSAYRTLLQRTVDPGQWPVYDMMSR